MGGRSRLVLGAGVLLGLVLVTLGVSPGFGQTTATTEKPGAFRFAAVDGAALGLWEGERPILVYNHGFRPKKDDPTAKPHNCYIHPLYGLDGEVLTDDFPADHLHHRGIFWAWPHVTVDGHHHDLWVQDGIENRFERWTGRETGAEEAVLGVENAWHADGRRVMREELLIRVHRAEATGRAIDLDLTWTPLEKPITLSGAEGKSYGGVTLRYAPGADTRITVPSGRTTDDLYMTRLPWADFTRRWDAHATTSGAAVFVGPDHPDFPPTWLTRHYGALCVGWPGVQSHTLEAGKAVRCRYRIWVHRGTPSADETARAFASYSGKAAQEPAARPASP